MTNYRDAKLEKGIIWNDKSINIKWPVKKPIVSIKDKNNMTFNQYINTYE